MSRALINGEYLDVEDEIFTPDPQAEIQALKQELASYDYIGVKIAMGVATVEEYQEQIAYTEKLRAKIRALEGTERVTLIIEVNLRKLQKKKDRKFWLKNERILKE